MKILRIVLTVLCAVCLAALYPVGAFLDMGYALLLLLAAGGFFLAMLAVKKAQEKKERGEEAPAPDFFTPAEKNQGEDAKK